MDVTKETFPAVSGQVIDFIKTCDFYAIDTELTGVMVPAMPEGLCDTPERNYALKGTAATRYSIIQFGICTFHKVENNAKNKKMLGGMRTTTGGPVNPDSHYVARPFNFFLFPSEHPLSLGGNSDRTLERDLILNPGAISFNRRYKMDFQKWIYHGVPYCNAPLERKMEHFLDIDAKADADKKRLAADREVSFATLSSNDEREYFIKCEQMAKEFMREVSAEEAAKRPKELMLPSTKSRVARETTQAYLEATHSPRLLVATRGRFPNRDLCLVRVSTDEMAKLRERQAAKRSTRLLDFVGFRTIFNAMVASKKPIVGHNCLVDLLFMQTAFDEPLDLTSLAAYKQHIHEQFPLIFDTKAIAVNTDYFPENRFDSKSLEPLFTNYKEKPVMVSSIHNNNHNNNNNTDTDKKRPSSSASTSASLGKVPLALPTFSLPLGFQSYEDDTLNRARQGNASAAHEAGYDALMTGQVLLNLLTEAGRLEASNSSSKTAASNNNKGLQSTAARAGPAPICPRRANKSSSSLFDEAAKHFGNYIHLHRSLYLLDIETTEAEKEKLFEGGVSDVFTATNGVVLLSYEADKLLSHHILESKVLSIGYEGCKVLEVAPGLAVIALTEKAVDDICIRNQIPMTSPSQTEALPSASAPTPASVTDAARPWEHYYYANPAAVEAAVREINNKFGPGNITAEVFIPYHARTKSGTTISRLAAADCGGGNNNKSNSTKKPAKTNGNNATSDDATSAAVRSANDGFAPSPHIRSALGGCSHPSIAAAFQGLPSPFNVLPPEVLAACGVGSGHLAYNPLPPSNNHNTVPPPPATHQKRNYHANSCGAATMAAATMSPHAALPFPPTLGLRVNGNGNAMRFGTNSTAWGRSLFRRIVTKH